MTKSIDYSVVIRTIGKAGEKYRHLLQSVKQLEPSPIEVIVVLPEGYELPEEKLGSERFAFSKKGMTFQRLAGAAECKTRYALFCDDDVAFPSDFGSKLYEGLRAEDAGFSAAPLYSFLPDTALHRTMDCLMARAVPTVFHKNRYNTVLRTTGYSYNRHLKKSTPYYDTQSLPGTCFFADVLQMRSVELEDESWIEAHGYGALEDQTLFYKALLRNIKTIVVTDAAYEHMDAKTSFRANKLPVLYSIRFNRIVFWHRFIYTLQENAILKFWSVIAYGYRGTCECLFDLLCRVIRRYSKEEYRELGKARKDGWKYIKGEEYKSLPSVKMILE